MGGGGGGSKIVGVNSIVSLLSLLKRSMSIAIWLMMHVLRKRMWGSSMMSRVEQRGVLILDAFLCF